MKENNNNPALFSHALQPINKEIVKEALREEFQNDLLSSNDRLLTVETLLISKLRRWFDQTGTRQSEGHELLGHRGGQEALTEIQGKENK